MIRIKIKKLNKNNNRKQNQNRIMIQLIIFQNSNLHLTLITLTREVRVKELFNHLNCKMITSTMIPYFKFKIIKNRGILISKNKARMKIMNQNRKKKLLSLR